MQEKAKGAWHKDLDKTQTNPRQHGERKVTLVGQSNFTPKSGHYWNKTRCEEGGRCSQSSWTQRPGDDLNKTRTNSKQGRANSGQHLNQTSCDKTRTRSRQDPDKLQTRPGQWPRKLLELPEMMKVDHLRRTCGQPQSLWHNLGNWTKFTHKIQHFENLHASLRDRPLTLSGPDFAS